MALTHTLEPISLYRQTLAARQKLYEAAIFTGKYSPYVYPWDSLAGLWLFLAILLFPRLPPKLVQALRIPVFILILVHCIWVGKNCRALNFAGGYGIGLTCAWGCIMSVSLVLLKDVGSDFRRLEARYLPAVSKGKNETNGSITSSADAPRGNLHKRTSPTIKDAASSQMAVHSTDESLTHPYKLVWQGYPSNIYHAIDWSIDLMAAFRGVNWNFRIPTLAPLSVPDPASQIATTSSKPTPSSLQPIPSLKALQLDGIRDFVTYYMILDFLKTTMMTDPYFLGLAPLSSSSPWSWLTHLPTPLIPLTTKLTRLLMSMLGVISALSFIFSLSPLFFTLLLPRLLSPSTLSKITSAPLLSPQMYPAYFLPSPLSPFRHILSHSLAGLWGKFWHQLFRHGISTPGASLTHYLNIAPRSNAARAIQLFTAFFLSGAIHATASYTTFNPHPTSNPSRPLSGPMAFFLLQAVGILLHSFLVQRLHSFVDAHSVPAWLKRAANLVYTLAWLYATGPLLADDFARCGIWLFEPVPLSVFRGLGLGPGGKGEGWWCWGTQDQDGTSGVWWGWVGWWDGGSGSATDSWGGRRGLRVY